MPPHLDLAKTYTHADMILSSRSSPRLSLRRANSYNSLEKGPLSSTSSRFSFHHHASPPPSPSLPALVHRYGKPVPPPKPRKVLKGLLWLAGVALIVYYGLQRVESDHPVHAVGWAIHAEDQYEMISDDALPSFPTPVVVTDRRGRAKWTVSIPPDHQFPLEPKQYAEICEQNMEVSNHVQDLHRHLHIQHAAHFDYYHVDPNFMDVAEAEEHGLLPGMGSKQSAKTYHGSIIGEMSDDLVDTEVCEKTLTFVLETSDAGLGKSLMMLWTAYGLSKKEGRDFFIDDSRWAYGKYLSYFKPPPMPRCRPPPRHHMLPCPHHARHLLVSAATAGNTFGGAFNDHFEDARKMEVYRQRPMFEMARVGYEALFSLATADQLYVDNRISGLINRTLTAPHDVQGIITGIHVRRGDRHPYEFQYRDSYVPLDRYADKAKELLYQYFNASGLDELSYPTAEHKSLNVVASDDPDVYDSLEFKSAFRAQELIKLASKAEIPASTDVLAAIRKFVDESVGWEGGFFSGMFWSLGKATTVPATGTDNPADRTSIPPSEEALRLRELVGRAYLLDLAVLGQGSDKILCTVSSMGCRLLGVMMGWDKMVERKAWVNIDGDFDWRGVSW